ncbi:MAG: peptide chain release factor 1 [Chloroflexi bacterium]|nr:peptide chain release factor 1 [Chloroflexota bacterium]
MWEKLGNLENRYEELVALLAQPEVIADYERWQGLVKEQASLSALVAKHRELKAIQKELEQAQTLLAEENDEALLGLAREETEKLKGRQEALTQEIKLALLPKDAADERDVIVEIRAGTGGDEAGLFAADLFRMYSRYAEGKRWEVSILSHSDSEHDGFKEIIFEVRGRGAYSRLKYESGVHRVQRVPATEASGRIHTSTATVAVLPEADEVEVSIGPDDLRVDIYHSSGAGGQNVNKVSTAVRLTHLPTGTVVVCQDERSQLKNRLKAMAVLRARLLASERARQHQEVSQLRRSQVGTGERSEKIRTYNFPQDRLTDHRIGLTRHNLPGLLGGDLDALIDAVAAEEQARQLAESLS